MEISVSLKAIIAVMISFSLFIFTPVQVFSQAPPEKLGSSPAIGANPPAPAVEIGGQCRSGIETNVTSINATMPNNRSNEFGANTYDSQFTLSSSLIAKDLGSFSPADISDYDLKDLSTDEIKSVLCNLTPGNQTKVLMNIPVEDLINLTQRLTPLFFQDIVKSLPGDNGTQVKNRIGNLTR